MKPAWIWRFAGLLVGTGAVGVLAAAVTGERPMTAEELSGTRGACCKIDYLDAKACPTSKNKVSLSCLVSPKVCGAGREYSGNVVSKCSSDGPNTCVKTGSVDCFRSIPADQLEPWFMSCPSAGSDCVQSTITNCVTCASTGVPGPWFEADSMVCLPK